MRTHLLAAFLLLLTLGVSTSCGSEEPRKNDSTAVDTLHPVAGDWVRIYQPSDPDNLNPFLKTSAGANYINENIFQALFAVDPISMDFKPLLAVGMPVVNEANTEFTFEIRPEAVWDNKTPITGFDYEFTVKSFMNPAVKAAAHRSSYTMIADVRVDTANPKKFTVITNEASWRTFMSLSALEVLPRYVHDPEGLLDKYPVRQLIVKTGSVEEAKLLGEPNLVKFAEQYNSSGTGRSPELTVGSGPYALESWTTNQQVVLVRKKDWWGDQFVNEGNWWHAWPSKLIFRTISDRNTAIIGLKGEELDVIRDVLQKDFREALDNPDHILRNNYNLYTPDIFSYTAIGMNMRPSAKGRKPLFEDKRVRRAMAHLVNVDDAIENIYFGFGQRAVGPIAPMKGPLIFNDTLKPIPFSIEKAKELLAEAGWADSDGDNVLDKVINGRKVVFDAEFLIPNGSTTGMALAMQVKANAEKAGIIITIKSLDFPVLLGKLRNREFDMYGAQNVGAHFPDDLTQTFSTQSYLDGGTNHSGLCNATLDELMQQTLYEMDPVKRKDLYWRSQEIIYQEQPMIFIQVPKERVMIHKRFMAKANSLRPNYQVATFWAPKEKQRFK